MKRAAIILLFSIIVLPIFLYAMDYDDSDIHLIDLDSSRTASTSSDPDSPKNREELLLSVITFKLPKKRKITGKVQEALLDYALYAARIERIERKKRLLQEDRNDTVALLEHGNRFWATMDKRADYLKDCIERLRAIMDDTDSSEEDKKEAAYLNSGLEGRLKHVVRHLEELNKAMVRIEAEMNRIDEKIANFK